MTSVQRHSKLKLTDAKAGKARREAIETWQLSAAAWQLAAESWQQTNGEYEKLALAWEQAAEAWECATEKVFAPDTATALARPKRIEAWQEAAKAWKKAAVEMEKKVSELKQTIKSENTVITNRVKKSKIHRAN